MFKSMNSIKITGIITQILIILIILLIKVTKIIKIILNTNTQGVLNNFNIDLSLFL